MTESVAGKCLSRKILALFIKRLERLCLPEDFASTFYDFRIFYYEEKLSRAMWCNKENKIISASCTINSPGGRWGRSGFFIRWSIMKDSHSLVTRNYYNEKKFWAIGINSGNKNSSRVHKRKG